MVIRRKAELVAILNAAAEAEEKPEKVKKAKAEKKDEPQVEKVTWANNKAEIQAYLDSVGIAWEDTDKKADLMARLEE